MEQIGKVGVRGIELEGKAAINDRVNLTLAYSCWDAEIREDGTGGNIGNRPSREPRHRPGSTTRSRETESAAT